MNRFRFSRRALCMTAGGLLLATALSSCVTLYSMKLPKGSASLPDGIPSFDGGSLDGDLSLGGSLGSGSPFDSGSLDSGDIPSLIPLPSLPTPSIPGLEDLPPTHLFSQQSYQLPPGVDFTGFTLDGGYFVADFDKGLSKYKGMGRYLFVLDRTLTIDEMADCGKMPAILTHLQAGEAQAIPEYVVYSADEEHLRRIVVQRYNEETGREEAFFFDYVASAIDGKLPQIPGVEPPLLLEEEPAQRYSTQWLEWLVKKDAGSLYPMIGEGILPQFSYRGGQQTYPPSPFSIVKGDKSSRFSLSIGLSRKEFPYVSVGQDGSYLWTAFYRESGSDGPFASFSSTPWRWSIDGAFYFFDVEAISEGMNPGLKPDLSSNSYQTVFIVTDLKGRIVAWQEQTVDWTMSSELFLAEAVKEGLAKDWREGVVEIPGIEPEKYTADWFSWLKEDGGRTYPLLLGALSSSSYGVGYPACCWQIWPYEKGAQDPVSADSRFGLALSVDRSSLDTDNALQNDWTIYYRKKGSDDPYRAVHSSLYGYSSIGKRTIFYFEPFGHGMRLPNGYYGENFCYELCFVVKDQTSDRIIGWYQAEAEWNNTAKAYHAEAILKGILSL